MKKITVLVPSVRETRAADKVLETVKAELEAREGVEVNVVDLKDLQLPFFDNPKSPADASFENRHDSVKVWGDAVKNSDGVVMLTPEHNHSISASQKNAIDWLFAEWTDKPVALVAYNWGTTHAIDHLGCVLKKIGAKQISPVAHLDFMQEINLDGSVLDQARVDEKLSATFDELLK